MQHASEVKGTRGPWSHQEFRITVRCSTADVQSAFPLWADLPSEAVLGSEEGSMLFVGSGERRGVRGVFFHFPAQIPGCSDHGQNVEKLEVPSVFVAKWLNGKWGQEAQERPKAWRLAQRPVLGKVQIYFLTAGEANVKETEEKSPRVAKKHRAKSFLSSSCMKPGQRTTAPCVLFHQVLQASG